MVRLAKLTREHQTIIASWEPYGAEFVELDYALREGGWIDEFWGKADIFVAMKDDEVVGFSLLHDDAQGCEFRLALRSDKLGIGLGRVIAEATLYEAFETLGKPSVYLIVRLNNLRAQKLYNALGFESTCEVTKTVNNLLVRFIKMVKFKDYS